MGVIAEEALYEVVKHYLDDQFSVLRRPSSGIALWRSQITPHLDVDLPGKWTRPDLAAVHVWRHRFTPTFTLDLHGFEVKRADNGNEISIFEALAHTRIVHYSHLVWHVPDPDRMAGKLESVRANCKAFGVGLITFRSHTDTSSFDALEWPRKRAKPDPEIIDRFIQGGFTEHLAALDAWMPRGA